MDINVNGQAATYTATRKKSVYAVQTVKVVEGEEDFVMCQAFVDHGSSLHDALASKDASVFPYTLAGSEGSVISRAIVLGTGKKRVLDI